MARVVDRWHNRDRSRTSRYGVGLRWWAVWVEPGGKERKKAFPTKDAAAGFLAGNLVDIATGNYVKDTQSTFDDLWPRFERIKSNKSKPTRETYWYAWNGYVRPRWGTTLIKDVTKPAAEEWLAGLKTPAGKPLSASYEHKVVLVLKGLCELAADDGMIKRNPLVKLKHRRQPAAERRHLSVAQADALAEAMKPNDLMIWVMLETLMRRGEAAGLKGGDLDERRKRLRIHRDIDVDGAEDETKGRRHRDVPVHGELLARLKEAKKTSGIRGYLMPAPDGGPWTRDKWRSRWESARVASGVEDLDTHELRHTGVSWAIQAGANVKTIQRMVGHASAAMTLDVYGHLWDAELDVVAVKLGELVEAERAASRSANAPKPLQDHYD